MALSSDIRPALVPELRPATDHTGGMSPLFRRFAGWSALLAAVAGLVFTVAFAVVVQEGERWDQWVSWTSLLAGGLVAVPVTVALYAWLGRTEPEFALVGLLLGAAGALGSIVHGAFNLSELANPSEGGTGTLSAVNPRGVLTFAVTGLALLVFGWLMLRARDLPRQAAWLALTGAVLLLIVYVARLTVLDPKSEVIKVAALASGLAVLPAFYGLVGTRLLRGQRTIALGRAGA